MTDNLRGAVFMMLAMLGFAVEDALFKSATASVSPGAGTLIFGLTALTISIFYARATGIPVWSPAYLQPRLLIRTGFEMMGRLFFALSLAYVPLATTSAILQAAPLVVTLGAAVVLGEKVGPQRWAATLTGFAGVLLILRPGAEAFQPVTAFAILGMLGFALRDLATRTAPPSVHAAQLGVLGFAVVSAAGIIIMAFEPQVVAPDARALVLLLATGGVGVLAYTALTLAMRTGDVSVIAPFRYSRLLIAFGIAMLVFGERPDTATLAGAALIVGSGLYTLWRETRAGARARSGLKRRL
jgi:drug/metabolite transporter (DMT)-like permease